MTTSIFQLGVDSEQKVYELFGYTKLKADNDVELVTKWIEEQTHLPEIMNKRKIKNFLILNKFNIEKTKTKIEKYYSIRKTMRDAGFATTNPSIEKLRNASENCQWSVCPELKDNLYRIHFFELRSSDKLRTYETAKQFFNILELRLEEDYLTGDIFVIDFCNFSFRDYLKFSPKFLYQSLHIYQQVYSLRIKDVYLINTNSAISIVMAILKTIMKPKIFNRFHIYKDESCLNDFFTEKELPLNYGGKLPSTVELTENLNSKFVEYKRRFDQLDSFIKLERQFC